MSSWKGMCVKWLFVKWPTFSLGGELKLKNTFPYTCSYSQQHSFCHQWVLIKFYRPDIITESIFFRLYDLRVKWLVGEELSCVGKQTAVLFIHGRPQWCVERCVITGAEHVLWENTMGAISQRFYKLIVQILSKYVVIFIHLEVSNQVTNLDLLWELCCHGMCKFVTTSPLSPEIEPFCGKTWIINS